MAKRMLGAVAIAAVIGASTVHGSPAGAVAGRVAGAVTWHTVVRGESLASIGVRAGIEARTIATDNQLAAQAVLPAGLVLRLDNRHIVPPSVEQPSLTVNIPQRMLFYRDAAGAVEAYPVAVGRQSWRTPIGRFTIAVREANPTWDVPDSIRAEARRNGRELPRSVPPGPANPLGAYWLGLSIPGVGIHGTNAPSSIFAAVTHGCIRLHPDDIAALFPQVEAGMPGSLVYEPVLLAYEGGSVFLEVHRDVYHQLTQPPHELARRMAIEQGIFDRIDWNVADAVIQAREGIAREVTRP